MKALSTGPLLAGSMVEKNIGWFYCTQTFRGLLLYRNMLSIKVHNVTVQAVGAVHSK
jgi:hypothetical protein